MQPWCSLHHLYISVVYSFFSFIPSCSPIYKYTTKYNKQMQSGFITKSYGVMYGRLNNIYFSYQNVSLTTGCYAICVKAIVECISTQQLLQTYDVSCCNMILLAAKTLTIMIMIIQHRHICFVSGHDYVCSRLKRNCSHAKICKHMSGECMFADSQIEYSLKYYV